MSGVDTDGALNLHARNDYQRDHHKNMHVELTLFLLAGNAQDTSKALIVVEFGHFVPGVHNPQTT